jgi:exonuclease SbcD
MTSKQLRIAHVGDTHLGYHKFKHETGTPPENQRTVDVRKALTWAVDDILERHLNGAEPFDLFVHSGDIFDHPKPDNMTDVLVVAQCVQLLEAAGIPQVWIAGNHDMSRVNRPDTVLTMLAGLLTSSRTRFAINRDATELEFVTDSGIPVSVDGVGWEGWRMFEGHRSATPETVQVLVAHGDVRNETDGDRTYAVGERDNWYPFKVGAGAYDYVALGHIHIPTTTGSQRVVYSGSTERYGWRDYLATPGYLITNLSAGETRAVSTRRVEGPCRPFVDLGEVEYDGDTQSVADWFERQFRRDNTALLEHAIIRCMVTNVPTSRQHDLRTVAEGLYGRWVWDLQVNCTTPNTYRAFGGDVIVPTKSLNLATLFEDYVAQMNDEVDGFKERFREVGVEALERALEEANAYEGDEG